MKFKRSILLILGLLLLISCGCSVRTTHVGQSIQPEDVIRVLTDGSHDGTWKTFDMTIDYEYKVDGNLLHVSGTGELSDHYQMLYERVRNLWVYLFVLDKNSRVIESLSLPVHMRTTEGRFAFERFVDLSDEVYGLSFGYHGHAYEFDGHTIFFYP